MNNKLYSTIDLNLFNDSKNEERDSSINLFELEEEKYLKKFSNSSFRKELSLMSYNLGADKNSESPLHDFEKLKEKNKKIKYKLTILFVIHLKIVKFLIFSLQLILNLKKILF